jgi:hypothetical protein
MSFEENIKSWVALDNQLKKINENSKKIRNDKNNIETGILTYVETNNLNNANINISDGKLRFVSTKQTAPLTLKYIEECLIKSIGNEKEVMKIMKTIKESRDVNYSFDIKRYTNN